MLQNDLHSTENDAVLVSVMIADNIVVVEYTYLEDSVVCADAQVRQRQHAHKLTNIDQISSYYYYHYYYSIYIVRIMCLYT